MKDIWVRRRPAIMTIMERCPRRSIGVFAWVADIRVLKVMIPLAIALMPVAIQAQSPGSCQNCTASAVCNDQRDGCVAECRARLFNIDPRRADCIAQCVTAAAHCTRQTETSCQAGKSCP